MYSSGWEAGGGAWVWRRPLRVWEEETVEHKSHPNREIKMHE
ncbi:hypothetical protein A2U01_0107261, partial [Trifolium medium]|nr:hypothetical protein [Trifolium medium]